MISVRVNGTMKEAKSKRAVGDLYNEEDIDVKMFASHPCCGQIQVGLLLAETQS